MPGFTVIIKYQRIRWRVVNEVRVFEQSIPRSVFLIFFGSDLYCKI